VSARITAERPGEGRHSETHAAWSRFVGPVTCGCPGDAGKDRQPEGCLEGVVAPVWSDRLVSRRPHAAIPVRVARFGELWPSFGRKSRKLDPNCCLR